MGKLQRIITTLALGSVAILVAQCASTAPVKEMSDARQEIALAQKEDAEKHAPDELDASITALKKAHDELAAGENDTAKASALTADATAVKARLDSVGPYTADMEEKAAKLIASADEAYAEKLASDDFESAKMLKEKGDDEHAKAKDLKSGAADEGDAATAVASGEILTQYRTAYENYQQSQDAAAKARATALAQKDQLLSSLSAAQSILEKARSYEAEQTAPEEYAAAQEEIQKARDLINDDMLKDGAMSIERSEELARAALDAALPAYAKKRKAEADLAVGSAKKNFDGYKRKGSQAEVQSIGEFVRAADEALTAAGNNLDEENYEESISESEEAIRLASIISEKTGTALAERKTDETPVSAEGWKNYKVQKKRPADTLWRISGMKEHYGNPFLWKRIYKANQDKIKNPNLIFPGQVLDIPPKTGPITKPAKEDTVEDMDNSDMDRENVE
ncbi:MAG: LysM peptidoglycan-binding domain-containing protein [Leptospiraceae bacterium]|nr:LysM peptidoglycan-binding domain-containing protein [Leptospiraceae bacterium]